MKNIVKNVFLGFAIASIAMFFACNGTGNNPNSPVLPNEKITIEFDEVKVNAYVQGPIRSGFEVKVGYIITLSASNLEANKLVDYWLINDNKRAELNARNIRYTVNANDVKNENGKKVIKFSYVTRDRSKEKIKVIFDNTVIATNHGNSISSGRSFVEGIPLSFKAQLKDGKMVENWFLNDLEQKEKGNEFNYTLNINDAKGEAGNKSITVKFSEKIAKKIVLKFDDTVFNEMRDRKDDETIAQNTEVLDGTRLAFVLKKDAEKVKVIEYITTNGVKNDAFVKVFFPYGTVYNYEVNEKDAKDEGGKPTINVGAMFKEAKKAIVKFDSSNIVAFLGGGSNAKEIQNDSEVREKDYLQFSIKDGVEKIAEKWFLNGKPIANSYPKFVYFEVSSKDMKMEGGKNILHITAEFRDSKKFTIKFADEITCYKDGRGTDIVASGSEVKEAQSLYFSAKQPKDKIFEKWLVNGKIKERYTGSRSAFRYEVDKQDANSENVIEVSISSHTSAKAKLELLKDDIKAIKYENGSSSPIQKGSEVTEGENLSFSVNYSIFNGKIIDSWFINGEEFIPGDNEHMEENKSRISFYLNPDRIKKEGSENIIKVDYKVKEPKKAKLVLQKDIIKAERSSTDLANGDEVSEGEGLRFRVENSDKIVEKWFINGIEFRTYFQDKSRIYFTLQENQIIKEGGVDVVKIDCEVREAKEIKIEYDTAKIVKDSHNGVDSGAKVKEGKSVFFKTKAGVLAEDWLINGKDTQNWSYSTSLQYTVRAKDAIEKDGELVVVISIIEREAVDCPIVFDSDKIECKNGTKDVANEEKVLEGTVLTFKAKGLSESQIIRWRTNVNIYGSDTANKPFQYTVNKNDVRSYNGKKVIRVWYEEQ
ncbi:MAG: hypothetical protein ACTTKH_04580 [Treponema sp.]